MAHHYHSYVFKTTTNNTKLLYNDRPLFWSARYPGWEIASGGYQVLINAMQSASMDAATSEACGVIAKERTTIVF